MFPRDREHGFHGNVNGFPFDREQYGAPRGALFTMAEGRPKSPPRSSSSAGRKGKLARTIYLFVQLPYKIFYDKAFPTLKAQTLAAYLIAGGSPPACAAVLETGSVPEYVFQTTADWIYGECALAGRSRPMLLRLLEQLMRRGASPIAQTTLAEESGMANNTVAHGYLDLLSDLLVLGASEPWDPARKVRVSRKASKYPFVNLLAANTCR